MKNEFLKSIFISLGLHSTIVLAFLLMSYFVFTSSNNQDIHIIKASVRVDVVGMPKLTIQELRKMQQESLEPKEEIKEEAKKEEIAIKPTDVVEEKKDKPQEKKLMSFLEKISQQDVKKKPKKGTEDGKNIKLEGNQLSQGTALVGDINTGPNSPFALYVQTLPDLVKPHWNLPSYIRELNLKCRIMVYISSSGTILKVNIFESSGNVDYDQRAIAAIKAASPFSKPPEDVSKVLGMKGVVLAFPL